MLFIRIEKVVIILNEMLGENNRFREKVGVWYDHDF